VDVGYEFRETKAARGDDDEAGGGRVDSESGGLLEEGKEIYPEPLSAMKIG